MNKKNDPVQLTGKVKVNKEGEGKKFVKLFFTGSFFDAIKHAFVNVFIPYTKDVICRTSTNVVNYWVNGDKPVNNTGNGANRISYWSGANSYNKPNNYSTPTQAKVNNVYSVGTLYFEDRGDAEAVLIRLKENLATYKVVSVADLYELSGEKFSFTDYKYGWRNLDSAYVGRTNDGKYVIELPKITPIE